MNLELTDKDRKILRYEKRMGYVLGGLLICFGGLYNLMHFVANKAEPEYLRTGLIDLGILLLAYFVCNRVNLKLNRDLRENIKSVKNIKLESKVAMKSWEAGSGVLYIAILGYLFPKLWGQRMRETRRYFLLTKDAKYEVEKDVYDELEEGSWYNVYYAKHSDTVLEFSNRLEQFG